MSSNDLNMEATEKQNVTFTADEISQIKDITEKYSEMYKEAVQIQQEISQSESRLLSLIKEMEDAKRSELDLFTNLAEEKQMDPKTVATAAANYILSEKR
jgi:hypothetical protein